MESCCVHSTARAVPLCSHLRCHSWRERRESQRGAGAPGNRDEGIGEGGEPGAPGRGVNTALLFIYALPGCSPAGGYYVQVQYSTLRRREGEANNIAVRSKSCMPEPDDAWPAALNDER
jgi:hypothetical protein